MPYDPRPAIERFVDKCQFEPETGCVLWVGGRTYGRGKNIRYGIFRDSATTEPGKAFKTPWLAHRWSAKHIHKLEITGLQVDHCCPNRPLPNTLCMEHLQPLTGDANRWLQTERRRNFIQMEVGLLNFADVYGEPRELEDLIPFYEPPEWLRRIST